MTGHESQLGVYAQQKPEICYLSDSFSVAGFLHLCIVISFIVPSALLVKNIVYEKEQRLKEQMRIMGLGDSVHFVSWALVAYVLNLLTICIIAVLASKAQLLSRANVFVLLLWLALYALSLVSLSIFISTWYTNANKATGMSTVLNFIFMFPAIYARRRGGRLFSLLTLSLPQCALVYASWTIGYVDAGERANWRNMMQILNPVTEVYLWECLLALAVDAIVYWILAWYISAINPETFGIREPWYFPFTKSYWCPTCCLKAEDEGEGTERSSEDLDRFEPVPRELKATVRISNLSKEYDNGTVALHGLGLNLYESQITALLGHNGAGRTTTMSMLCGVYQPSSGTATIYGRDLRL